MKKVLVFGVFDGLHEGHKKLLEQAKGLGDHLTVVLATDGITWKLKNRYPQLLFTKRRDDLVDCAFVDEVVMGDDELGAYAILDKVKPDIIALGYDQEALEADLQRYIGEKNLKIELKTMKPYKPESFKSSLIRKYPEDENE